MSKTFLCFLYITFVLNLSVFAQPELDPSFNSNGKFVQGGSLSVARDVAVQADNKMVMVSRCGTVFGPFSFCALRLNEDGTPDATFGDGMILPGFILTRPGSGGEGTTDGIEIQDDGKLVLVGTVNFSFPERKNAVVARYNSDGSFDKTFGTDGAISIDVSAGEEDFGKDVVIQPDGKIVIVGYSTIANNTFNNQFIARLNSDGSLDNTFGTNGIVRTVIANDRTWGENVTLQSDGKILVGGAMVTVAGGQKSTGSYLLTRLNTDGSLDTTWDNDGYKSIVYGTGGFDGSGILSVVVQTDQQIVALGRQNIIYRFNQDGSLDANFDGDGSRSALPEFSSLQVNDLAISPGGRITVVGHARTAPDFDYEYVIAKYLPDGSPDPSFSGDGVLEIDVGSSKRDSAWSIAFGADGRAAIAGLSATGTVNVPFENGSFSAVRLVAETSLTNGVAPFDFDGDSKTDLSIFRPSVEQWWYLRSSDLSSRTVGFGTVTDKLVPADYTGDGKTDVAFWRPETGEWFVLRSEDYSFYAVPFGSNGDIPAPGDFDGDGMADTAVFRPSIGTWFIQRSSDNGTTIEGFGISEDRPTIDDFDGDGKDDIAIYRPSVSEWWQLRSTDGVIAYQFGSPEDMTVPGDYTGDDKADIAFFRPSTGNWFVLRSEDNSFYSVPFGLSTDIPTPGDFDGDGQNDTAIFRPSENIWYVQGSTSGFFQTGFGQTDDIPIPNIYVAP